MDIKVIIAMPHAWTLKFEGRGSAGRPKGGKTLTIIRTWADVLWRNRRHVDKLPCGAWRRLMQWRTRS